MIKDDIINVKMCVLKVSIHCQACVKKVKKIVHKVDGVYQSTVNRDGMVTVSGLMDPDMVIKKLNKAGKRAQLWGAEPQILISHPQKVLLGSSGGDQQPKDGDKVQSKAGSDAASSSGESKGAAKNVMPQPTPQQLLRQQLMKELMVPSGPKGGMGGGNGKTASFLVAAPPAKGSSKAVKFNIPDDEEEFEDNGELYDGSDMEDFEDEGIDDDDIIPITMPSAALVGNKRGGGTKEIPVQVKAKANNTGKVVVPAMKQNLQGAGVRVANNNGGAQPPPISKQAGAPSGRNKPAGQANKVGGAGGLPTGVRGPKMGGMPPQQQPGMVIRPPNMMGSGGAAAYPGMSQMGGWPMGGTGMPMGHPHMASNGMQPGGGSAIAHGTAAGGGMMPGAGFYPGGAAGGSVAGGMAFAPEQYMPMMPQHQPPMMMNGHGLGPCCHHVHGGAGYLPQMGCGYGHPPAYYPPMPRHPHDNMFSDENPNSYCSVM